MLRRTPVWWAQDQAVARIATGKGQDGHPVHRDRPRPPRPPLQTRTTPGPPCVKETVAHKQYLVGTVYEMPGKYWNALMDAAVDNGGYVTPSLVAPHGVPAVELRKMVSLGTLQAAALGVYRIPSLPCPVTE